VVGGCGVDYDVIASYFLIPTGAEPSAPVLADTSARRLRDSIEAIATIGWWSRESAEATVGLGHGFFDGYVWGRAAALGADVAPSVVVSAFGVFETGFLSAVYDQARTVSSRDDVLAARERGAAAGLRSATGSIDPALIESVGERLAAAVASVEPGPRHLFGALQALAIPPDPYGRLWRAAELVREHRGDTHLAACVSAGLDMAEMNVLTEVWLGYSVGEYSSTRGFSPDLLQAAAARLHTRRWFDADSRLTTDGQAARDEIEARTDLGQTQLIDAIGDDLDHIIDGCSTINDAILAAHAAPADPRKRAAG
jgi:hypothetical protein